MQVFPFSHHSVPPRLVVTKTLLVLWSAITLSGLATSVSVDAIENVVSEPDLKESTPDPFDRVLRRAIEAMDESYDGWQHRPEETVDSTTFTINYSASISTDGRRRLDRVLILHADKNSDRKVSREEAIRFLEIQLGIRWITDDYLRMEDGRVVDFANFLRCDVDQNDRLSKTEFVDTWWNSDTAERDFEDFDQDGDGEVTLAEFSRRNGPYLRDPIAMFRSADRNGDDGLDAAELKASVSSGRAHLVGPNLKAFDDDDDGKLSLAEYRVSMLANFNYPWDMRPQDEDRDGRISYAEFKFHPRNLFQLQKRYYFHRLDRDQDNYLDTDEFDFEQYRLHSLYRVSVDGENSRKLYQHEDFPIVSSPSVSRDGRGILFDATPPEGAHQAQIIWISADGQDARDICDGVMPSWSRRGQFACCRYEGGASVWIMNTDGTPAKRIDDGWAAQWSPDGKSIAYTNDNSIRIYDVASEKSRTALAKGDHPYQYIFWNMTWSPDSRQIAFKGKLDGTHELAILSLDGPSQLNRRFATSNEMADDLAWSPDGGRLLFNMHSRPHRHKVIFQLDVQTDRPPRVVPEINTALPWTSVTFAPNGKWMVLTTPN
ncbi:MAG: hypothetical protein ACR2NZ_15625 [Rubripirellula sp.]